MTYQPPVDEMIHILNVVTGLQAPAKQSDVGLNVPPELVRSILQEAAKLAADKWAPLNMVGDRKGAHLSGRDVAMPGELKSAYRDWAQAGWPSLSGPEEFGGQGLPTTLSIMTGEMWASANMALSLGPLLTLGAIDALVAHGTAELKQRYLPKLISGEWMATMNLTEPQAGSDLNALRARAVPQSEGTYRLFGQKIYITFGEHDLTDNIIHLVLARLPDAPAGTRGLSLFLVPKVLIDENGGLDQRNDVYCAGLERKLGIHASPTCTMVYGEGVYGSVAPDGQVQAGAVGYLLGEANKGLKCMFTMMNNARLAVGVQGVALAEAATQKAVHYAQERRQGRAVQKSDGVQNQGPQNQVVPSHATQPHDAMSAIIEHPDVTRMLSSMQAMTAASRAICYACARAIDMARLCDGEDAHFWQARADLLTPIAKAFSTDMGVEVASLGVQVHGGMGFVEDTGAAQFLRDVRITPIYEGTNGIQAIDLLLRKLVHDDGQSVAAFLTELEAVAETARTRNEAPFATLGEELARALSDVQAATGWLLKAVREGRETQALAGATAYLKMFGLTAGACYLTRSGLTSTDGSAAGRRSKLAAFFAAHHLSATSGLRTAIAAGADHLMAVDEIVGIA